jgi:signal transduction histidine kinase
MDGTPAERWNRVMRTGPGAELGANRALSLALLPAGVALAVLAYEVQVDRLVISDARAAVPVAVGLAFLLTGLVAWTRRPANRLGALMVATGFALLLRQLRYSHDAFAFTFFFALGDLGYALLAHTLLAYPSGSVRDRLERRLMQAGYATVIVFPVVVLLLHDERDRLRQFGHLARKSDILIVRSGHAVELLQQSYTVVFFGVLAALFAAAVVRRRPRAAPLVVAAAAVALRAAYEWVVIFGDGTLVEDTVLFWLSSGLFAAMPALLLVALLREPGPEEHGRIEVAVRIAAATDAERRRIERDLHDGAQQRLVTLALELRAARTRVGPEAGQVLDSAVGQLQDAVAELRELARGVHPALLTENGLAAALESLAMRAPLPVVLGEAPRRRFGADVEAAAYFVASEGLANVVKHAGAGHATISARQRNGSLVVEVADDGVGGAGLDGSSGLRGLADRVEALGGALAVESPAGGGTRLHAEIPCAS